MDRAPGTAPELVTLHVWGVRRRHLPWVGGQLAAPRRRFRDVAGLRFARLLGTGHGRRFTPADADPGHWALLAAWDTASAAAAFDRQPLIRGWDARSFERCRVDLQTLSSTGSWSGLQPFGPPAPQLPERADTPCAVLTRARLVALRAGRFWRAIPPVAAALPKASGLLFARGIGEAPIGLQATFSVWEDLEAVKAFAYGTPAHRHVVEQTAATGWYAEQLFARFQVLAASGTVDGRNPLDSGTRP